MIAEAYRGSAVLRSECVEIAADFYNGSVDRLCAALEERTHIVETAHELIFADVFDAFIDNERRAVAEFSLSDVPLAQAEATSVLQRTFAIPPADAAAALRRLSSSGSIQIFGVDRFKIHDAIRPLGRAFLKDCRSATVKTAQEAIRDLFMVALPKEHDRQRVFLLLRMFMVLGDVKPLVAMATDELFHELG